MGVVVFVLSRILTSVRLLQHLLQICSHIYCMTPNPHGRLSGLRSGISSSFVLLLCPLHNNYHKGGGHGSSRILTKISLI